MKVPCCLVCQSRYDEEERVPLLLQCGHGFCKDCLSKMFSSCPDATLVCPRCRHVTVVGNSVQALRKNFAVLALIHSSTNGVSSAAAANFDSDYTDDEDGDDDEDEDGDRRCARGSHTSSSGGCGPAIDSWLHTWGLLVA